MQCATDSDCPAGLTCDTSLFSCQLPGGGPPMCGQCSSDDQCVSSLGLTLKCDVASSCCYDAVGGTCDAVEVKCKGAPGVWV